MDYTDYKTRKDRLGKESNFLEYAVLTLLALAIGILLIELIF